jgi:hypothetical protein
VQWFDTFVRPADVVVTTDLAGAAGDTIETMEIPG